MVMTTSVSSSLPCRLLLVLKPHSHRRRDATKRSRFVDRFVVSFQLCTQAWPENLKVGDSALFSHPFPSLSFLFHPFLFPYLPSLFLRQGKGKEGKALPFPCPPFLSLSLPFPAPVSDMTYNVFSGMLNPTQSINQYFPCLPSFFHFALPLLFLPLNQARGLGSAVSCPMQRVRMEPDRKTLVLYLVQICAIRTHSHRLTIFFYFPFSIFIPLSSKFLQHRCLRLYINCDRNVVVNFV